MNTTMVGIKSVMVLASVMLASVALAQPYPYIEWTRTYGGTGDDVGKSIQITEDGGYIIGGYTNSFGAQGYDMYLIRTDEWGDTLWTRRYGGAFDQSCNSVQVASDGGYLLAGYSRPSASGAYQLYLIKTNSAGDVVWNRIYENSSGANSIHPTNDGGYVVAGGSYIMKINSVGDSLWTRTVTGYANCAKQTSDGGYLAVGCRGVVSGLSYMHATKFDANGSLQWVHDYYNETGHGEGLSSWNNAHDFVLALNNGFVLVGECGGYFFEFPYYEDYWNQMYLVRVSSSGSQLAYRVISGGAYMLCAYAVDITQSGGYVIAGGASPSTHMWVSTNFYVLKQSIALATEWSTTYGSTEAGNEAYDIEQTSDRGYIIVGAFGAYSSTSGDVYLVKTGPDEPVGPLCLSVSVDSLHFGVIYQGNQSQNPLTVYNTCDSTVVLHALNAGEPSFYTDFDPADSLILPHDSLNITVFFSPLDSDIYNENLSIESSNGSAAVLLSGIGIPCISVSTDSLDFGLVPWGSEREKSLVIYNSGNCENALILRGLTSSNPIFFGNFNPADSLILPGDSLAVSVFFAPLDSDVYNATLIVQSSNAPITVQLHGVGIPNLEISNDTLNFGNVPLGSSLGLPLTIRNLGDTLVVLAHVFTTDQCFSTDYNPADSLLYAGDSLMVTVTFAPTQTIQYTKYLYVDSHDERVYARLLGRGIVTGISGDSHIGIPKAFALESLYPNPFNEATAIWYDVPVNSQVRLIAYDVLGRKVAELVNRETEPGYHSVTWDASGLPSGIYFVRMEAGEFVQTRKLVLLK